MMQRYSRPAALIAVMLLMLLCAACGGKKEAAAMTTSQPAVTAAASEKPAVALEKPEPTQIPSVPVTEEQVQAPSATAMPDMTEASTVTVGEEQAQVPSATGTADAGTEESDAMTEETALSEGTALSEEEKAAPEASESLVGKKNLIALTFDDGPDKWMTSKVLDVLERYGVTATFFLLGDKINEETAPLVERTANMGCEIGFHGWCHFNMSKVSKEYIIKQKNRFCAALENYVTTPISISIIRPAGGQHDAKTKVAAAEMNCNVILWDVDSADWLNQDKDMINKTVLGRVKDGSIILMHDRHQPTPDALETLIPALLEQGYTFVTVSELLARNGEEVTFGQLIRCIPPKEE